MKKSVIALVILFAACKHTSSVEVKNDSTVVKDSVKVQDSVKKSIDTLNHK